MIVLTEAGGNTGFSGVLKAVESNFVTYSPFSNFGFFETEGELGRRRRRRFFRRVGRAVGRVVRRPLGLVTRILPAPVALPAAIAVAGGGILASRIRKRREKKRAKKEAMKAGEGGLPPDQAPKVTKAIEHKQASIVQGLPSTVSPITVPPVMSMARPEVFSPPHLEDVFRTTIDAPGTIAFPRPPIFPRPPRYMPAIPEPPTVEPKDIIKIRKDDIMKYAPYVAGGVLLLLLARG